MKARRVFPLPFILAAVAGVFAAFAIAPRLSDASPQKTPEKPSQHTQAKPPEKSTAPSSPKISAEIELLETSVRFETDGSSRKEVHALVKINDELGVRQFGRLNFDFNRAFQSVEMPLVRITHPSGGTLDVLPSAITDQPNPAVVNAPAYQDVRVKSVRILGLEPGDTLEYRVVTTTSHAPLAPDFWLDHTFDRSGVVSNEIFLVDAPAAHLRVRINPDTPAVSQKSGDGASRRESFRWDLQQDKLKPEPTTEGESDVALTTFSSWSRLSNQISKSEESGFGTLIYHQADANGGSGFKRGSPQALYRLVSEKIATIDLPLELSLSVRRGAEQILESGYGTSEEKARLLATLMTQFGPEPRLVMYARGSSLAAELPRPTLLAGALLVTKVDSKQYFVDPSLEVAPFGVIQAKLRGQKSLNIAETSSDTNDCFTSLPLGLPFPSSQRVDVHAALTGDGRLTAKVKYTMRGDNELLLRVAFHETPKQNWKNVAQLLALSDGFRGQITSVTPSDPFETQNPFTVEYEITQPKFVNWSKKPVRIPALLPLLGLPDPAGKKPAGMAAQPIELGTPLDVHVTATLHLPSGTTAQIPIGTSVERDFATYASQYSAKDATITASRHLNFILRKIPADRAADYDAFLQTVQNDESQFFTLERVDPASSAKPPKL
ncbi:MAG: DUF3857 domain-containing protein [Candidatus Acidiferrum sp.]